jgi:hypothetical protein
MKNGILKLGKEEHTKYVDTSTGEMFDGESNNSYYLANTKEEFWLMYSSMVLILKGSTDVRMKLFAALLERYSRGQEFSMSKSLKIVIAKETGCKPRSFDSAFTYLLKQNIIVKVGSQLYKVNPRHVFQGSSTERNSQLKAILELHCKTC